MTDQAPDPQALRFFQEELDKGAQPKEAKAKALARVEAMKAIGADDGEQDLGAPTPFRADYLATPTEVRGSQGETVGKPEAAARAVARGATARNADEIAAYMQTSGANPATRAYRIAKGIPGEDNPNFEQERQQHLKTYRERDTAAEQDQPWTSRLAEIGGAAVTAPAMGGAKTLGQAALTGAKTGAAYGFGSSEASAKDSPGRVAAETVGGAVGGTIAGVAGYGIANAVSGGGRWLLDKLNLRSRVPDAATQNAEAVAADIAKPSAIGDSNETVGSNLDKSRKLMAEWKADGNALELTPAQASGSRAQALRELRLRQNPATMDEAQKFELQQLETAAKIADTYIGKIAADPRIIGKPLVAEQTAKVVSNYGERLLAARSATATPLYDAAKAAGGGVDYAPIKAAFDEVITENNLKPSQMTGLINNLYGKLEKTGAGGGLSLAELNSMRSKLLGVIRGKETLLGGAAPRDAESAMAGRLLSVIDQQFTAAEQTSSGPAAQLWRRANEAWRKGTEAYENAMTDTIQTLLKTSATDKAGDIPERLLNAGPGPIRAVFSILNNESPADAANLRAQMLETLLVKGGKPSKMSPTSAKLGFDKVEPGNIVNMLKAKGYGQELEAAFSGDTKALLGLQRMGELFRAVGFGPNIKGSTTQPQIADAIAELGGGGLQKMAAGNGWTALALQAAFKNIERVTSNNQVLAKSVSTREGIEATNKALGLILDGKMGKTITEQAARQTINALVSAGIMAADEIPRMGKKAEPQQPRHVPMERAPQPTEDLMGLGRGVAGQGYAP
jgi:hypothetical protein